MSKRQHSTELQIYTPKKKKHESSSSSRRLSSSHKSTFTLPDDWFVELKKRSHGASKGETYKYYHEPGTGRRFRSLASVERYLRETNSHGMTQSNVLPRAIALPGLDYENSEEFVKRFNRKSDNQIVVYRKRYTPKNQSKIDKSKPLQMLPNGWYVKRSLRRSGKVDKYYCERATGQVCRSLADVQRYLADNSIEENTTLSEIFKPDGFIQMYGSEENDVGNSSDMAMVPVKDIVRNADTVPLKVLVRKSSDVPHKDFVRKSKNVPPKNLVQNAHDVPLKGLVQRANDVNSKDTQRRSKAPKDVPRNSFDARKTSKHTNKLPLPLANVFSCTENILPVIEPNHPIKVRWVLNNHGGEDWRPFHG